VNERQTTEHVGELLSGFLDGELTQQDHQRVRLHCEACDDCRTALEEFRAMRERVGQARLSELDQDVWRETMDDTTVKASRGIGWLLLIGGGLLGAGFVVYNFLTGPQLSVFEKTVIGGIYGGLLLLFVSVLRQRLIERKTDKYKDVEI